MDSIWGKSFNAKDYSEKGYALFQSLIAQTRIECMLYMGTRFRDDSQIYWVLTSHVDEAQFAEAPKRFLFMVLLGACGADYYYKYEKEW